MDDWHSDWNPGLWMFLHDPGPQWQSLQIGTELIWSPYVMMAVPFKTGRDTSLKPAFIWPQNIDKGLTPRLSALLAETSPLAPYRKDENSQGSHQTENKHTKVTSFKTICGLYGKIIRNWLLSRPLCIHTILASFKTIWNLHSEISIRNWLILRPLCIRTELAHSHQSITGLFIIFCEIDFFQDHPWRNQEDTRHRGQVQFISHHHLHRRTFILDTSSILVTLIFISRPSYMASVVQ